MGINLKAPAKAYSVANQLFAWPAKSLTRNPLAAFVPKAIRSN